jgi:glycerophosphoryl diester phosphodiesterase
MEDLKMSKTQVWAHRGASAYAPENTIPAFKMAIEMGVDGFETDIHLTLDGELVISHDESLSRVSNGNGIIPEKTLKELKSLDFSNGKKGYKDVRLLTARELFEFVSDQNIFLNIEMKYSGNRWDETNEKMAAIAREYGMDDRILYSSFKEEPLLNLKKLVSSKIGFLYMEREIDKPWDFVRRLGFDALHPHFSHIYEPGLIENRKAYGLLLNPWTVDEVADLEAAFKSEIDAVITNKPDLALKVRREILGY